MSEVSPVVEKSSMGRWFVPALFICFFAATGDGPILRLFSASMAKDFNVQVGFVLQLSTVNNIAEVIIALLVAFLAVRFSHKSLLLVGIGLVAVSTVGNFLAPTLGLTLFFFAMEGIGSVIVGIIGLTLIGELLPLNKRGKAVGNMIAAGSASAIIGTFALGLIANVAGWRSTFILFVLPLAVVGLFLAFLILPSQSHEKPLSIGSRAYLASFKQVFLNKSAASCLLGGFLMSTTGLAIFATPYFIQKFLISPWMVIVFNAIAASVVVAASIVTGQLINRFGRKNLTVVGALVGSILAMPIFFIPNLWIGAAINMAHVWFIWTGITAFSSYVLEQAPKARGTMMSMRNIFSGLGAAMGAALGGALLVLLSFDLALSYQTVGLTLGAIGIAGSAVFYFLTKDPYSAR